MNRLNVATILTTAPTNVEVILVHLEVVMLLKFDRRNQFCVDVNFDLFTIE